MKVRLRWWFACGAFVFTVLFLLFGVNEVIFGGIPGAGPTTTAIVYHMVVSLLAPWYYACEWPAGPMLVFAIHISARDHLVNWAIFGLTSGTIWVVFLGGIHAAICRLRPSPHPLTVGSLIIGLSPALDLAPMLGASLVHGITTLRGPWWWLTQATGWPGGVLVRATVGPSWLPISGTRWMALEEHLGHWALFLGLNTVVWVTIGLLLQRLLRPSNARALK